MSNVKAILTTKKQQLEQSVSEYATRGKSVPTDLLSQLANINTILYFSIKIDETNANGIFMLRNN